MKSKHFLVVALVAFLMLLSSASPLLAGDSAPKGPTDPAELEAFMDGLVNRQLKENHIAGATVSIVKDGELFFQKGYGFANIKKGLRVDPETTRFRIGSVSKLITWTAVMQLVEQGKLDLDADVNKYLDFKIPATYPQQVTLRHLMTHTAGFEDRFINYLALKKEDMRPWKEWLIVNMPARVRPPGECSSYSNYGTSVAGYIVQRVSGEPFDEYLHKRLLDPLGMSHTTAELPMPVKPGRDSTEGYVYKNGALEPFPFYSGQSAIMPVGGIESSASDMARFMIAHLGGGLYSDSKLGDVRIMKDSTARTMHSIHHTHDPRLPGTALGFFDFSENGERVLGHNGEAMPTNTLLLLLPDRNIGIFISYNSSGGGILATQHLGFQKAFFEHYFTMKEATPLNPPADFAKRSGKFEGDYISVRYSNTTLEKLAGFFGTLQIKVAKDGALRLITPWGEWRFVEESPLCFREPKGQFRLVFREDKNGRVDRMYTSFTPMFAFDKLKPYETLNFHMKLLGVCSAIFIISALGALVCFLRNRASRGGDKKQTGSSTAATRVMIIISVLNLLFVLGTMKWGDPKPLFGVAIEYKIVLGLGVLSAALTAVAAALVLISLKGRNWSVSAKVYYTVVLAAQLAFLWSLNTWNLIGWKY